MRCTHAKKHCTILITHIKNKQKMSTSIKLTVMILVALVSFPCHAYDFESDGIYYNILSEADRTVEVTYLYSNADNKDAYRGSIKIPANVSHDSNTYTVTAIGREAFHVCTELTSLALPNSITAIESGAFLRCSGLTSATLSNSLTTLGDQVFAYCSSLTSINLPASLTTIGDIVFLNCSAMVNINVEAGNPMFSSFDGALYDRDATTILTCPAGKTSVAFPNSLTTVGVNAFRNCTDLTSVPLPGTLTVIENSAFTGCSGLTSITLPSSLTAIGIMAFSRCTALTSIQMQCMTPIECTPAFSADVLKNAILYIPQGTLAAYKAVEPWKNFANIEETDFSGVADIEAGEATSLRLTVSDGHLIIDGINDSENITISDMQGRTVYSGTARSIDGLVPGLYIIKTGRHTAKFSI